MQHHKFLIAKEHLQCAIDLFLSERYSSALTLAGASEEIFAGFIRTHTQKDPALKQVTRLIRRKIFPDDNEKDVINFLNKTKNAVKHPDVKGIFQPIVNCNIKEEASVLIMRALCNYCSFTECYSDDFRNIKKYLQIIDSDPHMHMKVNAL
ncbi:MULTISPECIES: hypothetical protein [Aeromonas]|uniref:hypothetical protein n=1 Tax=Aeromonas TaxID=642 RepID=UPI00191EDB41|nr:MULTISPECIES: hypothetical protein [Aeromonas]MBL0480013.1 hypothetical protein [Aeromonas veronii]MBL0675043.1 hypothetical protein [Aeromonas dhakensis]MDX7741245.1 hypothetical protein [Aeromonas dhakensis]UYB69648.1 hypothetical protein NBH81_14935 [Aeromonas veronii]